MSDASEDGQLELLPAGVPEVRRATLQVAQLSGWEHAQPGRELVGLVDRLGVLEPIVVAEVDGERYAVVEGRRRVKALAIRAAQRGAAEDGHVESVVVSGAGTDRSSVLAGLALALHASRGDSPVSELRAIETIVQAGGDEAATVKRIAQETGMSQQTVRRRLRLRNLSPVLRAAFDSGELGAAVAEAAARLGCEEQAELERALAAGERVTLPAVREIARKRTAQAAVALDAELFADHNPSWRPTVRGHLQAALEAIPIAERNGALAQAVANAIARAEDPNDAATCGP